MDLKVHLPVNSQVHKEGRKEIYSSLAANKAEWMENCLCISVPAPYQGRL